MRLLSTGGTQQCALLDKNVAFTVSSHAGDGRHFETEMQIKTLTYELIHLSFSNVDSKHYENRRPRSVVTYVQTDRQRSNFQHSAMFAGPEPEECAVTG